MRTSMFPCGCMISSSMFGDNETISVCLCDEHSKTDVGKELALVAKHLADLLNDWEDEEEEA